MTERASRRAMLKRSGRWLAAGALAAGASTAVRPARSAAPQKEGAPLEFKILLDEPIGTISPGIYSQFTEHIGGVVYDGIWVGPDSKIANIDGCRKTLIDHVRRLGPVTVRWPGGCFADRYHWRDGIGPRERRPRRYGRWRDDTESNQFGSHEFLGFCKAAGVEPYFAANVGTGTAEEFQQWVEYLNAPEGSTTLADERATNGHPAPYGVRTWGVGNESWGCGGKFTPEDYCREYRKFTEWVPGYGVPLYLIAAGPNGNDVDWTKRFFAKWVDYAHAPIQGWAPHYYCGTTGNALKFNTGEWYAMLAKANKMEALVRDQWAALAEHDPKHQIKLIVDEWGAWHPAGTEINRRHLFEQMGCLRDALVAALTLDTFNRHADKVAMSCIAQLVNNLHSLFLADEDKFVATPSFHVFEMYKPHQNGKSVRVEANGPSINFQAAAGEKGPIFRVAGSASRKEKMLTVTLVHTHASEPAEVEVKLEGGSAKEARATVLTHKELNAHNTFEKPDVVKPGELKADARGGSVRLTLPPAAVARVDVALG